MPSKRNPLTGNPEPENLKFFLEHLPGEITVINENDVIQFYTLSDPPIFSRTPDIIGTDVRDCHSPDSLPAIERMITKFRSGENDIAESWFRKGNMYIHTRYIALRDDEGNYRGMMEFVQDVTRVRKFRKDQRESLFDPE